MADIPGIIEGASEGVGLGHDFLRHIDRCRLIVHIVDVSGSEGRDPVEDLETINGELEQYSPELAKRPMIVVANKMDILQDPENLERLRAYTKEHDLPLYEMSAAIHIGHHGAHAGDCMTVFSELPPITVYEAGVCEAPASGGQRGRDHHRASGRPVAGVRPLAGTPDRGYQLRRLRVPDVF